jgi:dolichyl-diphosphooligosaccharide---protein glycosyltransferase
MDFFKSRSRDVVLIIVAISLAFRIYNSDIVVGQPIATLVTSTFGNSIGQIILLLLPTLSSAALAFSTFLLGKEVINNDGGIFASAFIATSPAILSHSLQSLDIDSTLILPLLSFTFFTWLRSIKATSIATCAVWSFIFSACYMTLLFVWQRDSEFIAWIIPLHAIFLQFSNQGGNTLYFSYSLWFACLSIVAFGVSSDENEIGFKNCAFLTALPSFCILQVAFIWKLFKTFSSNLQALPDVVVAILISMASGFFISRLDIDWDSLEAPLDPSVARRIGGSEYPHFSLFGMWPENQPSTLQNLVFDHGPMLVFAAFGIILCVIRMRPGDLLSLSLLIPSLYFSIQFRRFSILLALALSLLAGKSISLLLEQYSLAFIEIISNLYTRQKTSKSLWVKSLGSVSLILLLLHFWTTIESILTVFSAPSGGTFAAVHANKTRFEMSDIVDAGLWLRNNSSPDARILTWTTHGHEIAYYSQRTLIKGCEHSFDSVNNETSVIARAFLSQGVTASTLIRDELKADYVVIVFGGYVGLVQDDLEYVLWMSRVSDAYLSSKSSTKLSIPSERDLLTRKKELRIDAGGAPALLQSTIFSLSYFRFNEKTTEEKRPTGFDRARKTVSVKALLDTTLFEEVFTSKHWIARVYRVKKSNEDAASFLIPQSDDLLQALNKIEYEDDDL